MLRKKKMFQHQKRNVTVLITSRTEVNRYIPDNHVIIKSMKCYTKQCHKTNLISMPMSFINILHISIPTREKRKIYKSFFFSFPERRKSSKSICQSMHNKTDEVC